MTYLVTKLILHFKTKFLFKIYEILNNFIYFLFIYLEMITYKKSRYI